MSSTSVSLSAIPKGWYMSWTMATQTGNNVCVTLKDSTTTYVNNVCQLSIPYKVMSQGYQQVGGTGLTLTITESANPNPLTVQTLSTAVTLPNGTQVGQSYAILLEDGSDNDFNDLCVSIIAWASNG